MKFIYVAKLLHIVYEYMLLPAEDIGLRLGSLDRLLAPAQALSPPLAQDSGFGAWMNK